MGLLSEQLEGVAITGVAVLLHTGGDRAWGRPEYADEAPYLTTAATDWLVERRPAIVGIDSVNIDDLSDQTRPAHTGLLGQGIRVLEHLTNLAALLTTGSRLPAAPLAWPQIGTWPVRAYAAVEGD